MQLNAGEFQVIFYQPVCANMLQHRYFGTKGAASRVHESSRVCEMVIDMNNTSLQVHITKMLAMCRWIARGILRAFRTKDQEIILVSLRTFVVNSQEYCSQLKLPNSVKLIIAGLETALRCCTRKIASMKQLLGETARFTTLFPEMKTGDICDDIDMKEGLASRIIPSPKLNIIAHPPIPSRVRAIYWNSLWSKSRQAFNILPK